MDMILNGERGRKANHKMTGIGRRFCVQISESDQSLCYTNSLAFVSPCIHCIQIILDYVKSVKNQRVINR